MSWCGRIPALLEGDFYCSTSQLQPLRQGLPPSHVTRRSRVSPNTSHVSRHTPHFTRHTSLASHASHVTFSADNSVLFFHCFDCVAADTPPGPTDDEPSVGVGCGETVVPVFTWYVYILHCYTRVHMRQPQWGRRQPPQEGGESSAVTADAVTRH